MSNVRFRYLYRDGSNYKKWGNVIFSNEENISIDKVDERFWKILLSDGLFIAHQIRIPEQFLFNSEYPLNQDDHCFHEFYSVENTLEYSTDIYRRSILQFISEAEEEAQRGWLIFDPVEC